MTEARDLLSGIVGEWQGRYRVWLEPPAVHTDCRSMLHIEPLLDGRFVSGDYDWASGGATEHAPSSVEGQPQTGSFMLGCSTAGEWQMAWVDSWHNGDSILFSTGGPEPKVTGTYAETWGWRTEFELREPDHLVITAYNITPDGEEQIATEGDYRRT
ncbi:MAG TPA: DUF1579 family protein [Acidimicrobiales bacterium]|nr:DUF1579 family protein [Acidimicrobiales bacterium]